MIEVTDRLAIDDVLARYGWAIDAGDGPVYAALFAEDAVLTGYGEPLRGRAALAAMAENTLAQSGGALRHHLTNLVCRYLDGRDRVEARGYQLVTDWSKSPGTPLMMLEPVWTLARVGEAWVIEALHLAFVNPGVG